MKKILILGLILVCLTGCLAIEIKPPSSHTVLRPSETTEPQVVIPETVEVESPTAPASPTEPPVSIKLGAIGDVIASTENFNVAKSGSVYEFSGHFAPIKASFADHDFTIANLVSPIAGADYGYNGYPRYNAPVELAQALMDIGVDAVSTANRYSMDLGIKAVVSNLSNIRALGLKPFGTASSPEEAEQLLLVDVKGVKIGLLSYTAVLNQGTGQTPYAVAVTDQTKMAADIAALRGQGADIITVNLYWGDEYADQPNQGQIDLMAFLESQGVDIVLGAHPHVVQPLVVKDIVYNNQVKPMVQAYSLGNFYSAFLMSRTKTGLLLEIDITKENGQAKVSQVNHSLVYNHQAKRSDDQMDYQVINLDNLPDYYNDALYNEMEAEKTRVEGLLPSLNQ